MKISTVMNPNVHTCRPDESLGQAAMLMWKHDCGFVPVIEQDSRRVVGAITDRDICMATATRHIAPDTAKVQDTMCTKPITIRAEDEIDNALTTMKTHQVHRIPVVDSSDRLVGIVSFSDIVRLASTDGILRSIGDHDIVAVYRAIKTPRAGEPVGAGAELDRWKDEQPAAADRAFGETRES